RWLDRSGDDPRRRPLLRGRPARLGRHGMTKNVAEHVFLQVDLDYIETHCQPIHPVLATMETDAAPERIPILDRESGRVLAALAGPFDLAFIDALKHEYPGYLEAVIPRLASGALVVADNVLWSGRVSGSRPEDRSRETAALRAFNAAALRDPRFTSTILPVGDGLFLATLRR